MNFGYFGVFWRIFFEYTGIPLPLLADPAMLRSLLPDNPPSPEKVSHTNEGGGRGYSFRTGFRPNPRRLESLVVCRCMARTDHGKPAWSWNLRISISRPGKSWNLIVGP